MSRRVIKQCPKPDCAKKQFDERELFNHYKYRHMINELACAECFSQFREINELSKHFENVHPSLIEFRFITTEINGDRNYRGYEILATKKSSFEQKPNPIEDKILCSLCHGPFESLMLLQMHCISTHAEQFVTCSRCQLPFPSIPQLKVHLELDICSPYMKSSPNEEVELGIACVADEKCLLCKKVFIDKSAALHHYMECHLNIIYMCDICKTHFRRNNDLMKHYEIEHNPVTQIKTERNAFGSRSFNIPLISTLESRTVAAKFNEKICAICSKHFNTAKSVHDHLWSTHQIKIWMCDVCERGYIYEKSMRTHSAIHSSKVKIEKNTTPELIEKKTSSKRPIKAPVRYDAECESSKKMRVESKQQTNSTVVRSVPSKTSRNVSPKTDTERPAINKMITASTSLRNDARASTSFSKSSVQNDARTPSDNGKKNQQQSQQQPHKLPPNFVQRNVPIKMEVKSINVSRGGQSSLQSSSATKQIDTTKVATKRDSSGKIIQHQSQQQPRKILPTVDKKNNSNQTIQEKFVHVFKGSQSMKQSSSAKQIETTTAVMKREKIDQQQQQKLPINVGKRNDLNFQSKIEEKSTNVSSKGRQSLMQSSSTKKHNTSGTATKRDSDFSSTIQAVKEAWSNRLNLANSEKTQNVETKTDTQSNRESSKPTTSQKSSSSKSSPSKLHENRENPRTQMKSINSRPNFVFPSISKNRQSSKQHVDKSLEKRIPSDVKPTPKKVVTTLKSVESEQSPKTDHKIQKTNDETATARIVLESLKQKLPDMPALMLDETSQTSFNKLPAISRSSPTKGNCEKMPLQQQLKKPLAVSECSKQKIEQEENVVHAGVTNHVPRQSTEKKLGFVTHDHTYEHEVGLNQFVQKTEIGQPLTLMQSAINLEKSYEPSNRMPDEQNTDKSDGESGYASNTTPGNVAQGIPDVKIKMECVSDDDLQVICRYTYGTPARDRSTMPPPSEYYDLTLESDDENEDKEEWDLFMSMYKPGDVVIKQEIKQEPMD